MKRTKGAAPRASIKKVNGVGKWAKAKTRNGSMTTGSNAENHEADAKRIEALLENEDYRGARRLIARELSQHPDNHWLLTRLGLTHYEEKEYDKALTFTRHALALQPECPLVLWDYAGTLAMLGRTEEALGVYQQLLGRGVDAIAFDECGEGIDWAMQMLNDCHYRMGQCYRFLGDHKAAQFSFLKYLHNRSHGVASIYDTTKAEKQLAEVSQGHHPLRPARAPKS